MLSPGLVVTAAGPTWRGGILRNITARQPNGALVIFYWIMNSLAIAAALAISIGAALSEHGFQGFVFFWGGIGLAVLSAAQIYAQTQNYFRSKKPTKGSNSLKETNS
jgi:hypothetical protein